MNDAPAPPELPEDIAIVARVAAIPAILDVVCRSTGMGFAAVARVTADQWVACSVRDTINFGLKPGGELKVDTTICSEIRLHGKPIVIEDVAADPDFCGHQTPALYGFQSYISVPIFMPDHSFFGTLCAIDPQPRHLDKAEIIATFTLYAELIAFHLDANQRVAHSEALLLREREVAELREQFIAVLGHDLRNPLAALNAGMRMLARHPERTAEIAGHMRQSISRMAGLIDNIMDFARGRLGGGLTVTRDAHEPLAPVLEQIVQELQSTHTDRTIDLDVALHQPVSCDRARIGQMLSNLLGNALTHGKVDAPVRVQAHSGQGIFTLAVANSGPPIPHAQQENLFQPFFRGAERESQQGLGLGLYIAAEIAKAHGGRLVVASSDAETKFTFTMACHA